MENIPDKIYLQIGEDSDVTIDNSVNDFNDLYKGAITWNDERINKNDIEYERRQDANLKSAALPIFDVSQQRELLAAFAEHLDTVGGQFTPSWMIDNFLKAANKQAAMQYDRLLPAVNDDSEYEDWYEEEDYYYQCMVCGKAQEKFNGGSCFLCASPVEKITF